MKYSDRYNNIPPYLFFRMEEKVAVLKRKGVDIINLGIGDPDLPPPKIMIDAIKLHIDEPDTHFYSTSRGSLEVRKDIADWFQGRFKVDMDPESEITVTIGSKEGLANFSRAIVNPGDKVGVPSPGYPVYGNAASILNDGTAQYFILPKENGFKPRFEDMEGAQLAFLNYPNNPTGAVADEYFFRKLAEWTDAHPETVVVHDAAYSEMTFGDEPHPSLLQFTKNAIEFHSLSKIFNVTGYRIGFALGRKEYIDGLVKIKSQLDSGAPLFIQRAAADCLKAYQGAEPPVEVIANRGVYMRRKKLVEEGLSKLGYKVHPSPATFYIWFETVEDDMKWADRLIKTGVVVTPGQGFGEGGRGFARITATIPDDRLHEALERIGGM